MNKRIIYKNTDGSIAIIVPANCGLTVEQIAKKDVPTGLKYKIVNVSDILSDRTFRNAWTINDSELTDGIGEDITIDDINKENEVSEWLQ